MFSDFASIDTAGGSVLSTLHAGSHTTVFASYITTPTVVARSTPVIPSTIKKSADNETITDEKSGSQTHASSKGSRNSIIDETVIRSSSIKRGVDTDSSEGGRGPIGSTGSGAVIMPDKGAVDNRKGKENVDATGGDESKKLGENATGVMGPMGIANGKEATVSGKGKTEAMNMTVTVEGISPRDMSTTVNKKGRTDSGAAVGSERKLEDAGATDGKEGKAEAAGTTVGKEGKTGDMNTTVGKEGKAEAVGTTVGKEGKAEAVGTTVGKEGKAEAVGTTVGKEGKTGDTSTPVGKERKTEDAGATDGKEGKTGDTSTTVGKERKTEDAGAADGKEGKAEAVGTTVGKEGKMEDAGATVGKEGKTGDTSTTVGKEHKTEDAGAADGKEGKTEDTSTTVGKEGKTEDAGATDGKEGKTGDTSTTVGKERKTEDAGASVGKEGKAEAVGTTVGKEGKTGIKKDRMPSQDDIGQERNDETDYSDDATGADDDILGGQKETDGAVVKDKSPPQVQSPPEMPRTGIEHFCIQCSNVEVTCLYKPVISSNSYI